MTEEAEKQNRDIIESLLAAFEQAARRLTPDIEPATVYLPDDDQ